MKVLLAIFVIVGGIFGAGFASGKEIVIFFAQYGILSLLFIIPVFLLFFYLIYKIISLGNIIKKNNTKEINYQLFKNKNKYFNFFNTMCMIILSSSMCGAMREILQTHNIFTDILINLIIIILMFFVCKYDIKLLSIISSIFIPIVIVIMIYLISSNINSNISIFSYKPFMLAINTILYTSMNCYLSISIIAKIGKGLSKKQAIVVSFFVAFIICFILVLSILCILSNPTISDNSFPFLSLASSPIIFLLFNFVLIISIATTLFSCLVACKDTFIKIKGRNIILPLMVYLLSFIGFENIVSFLYPLIGIVGFLVFTKMLLFKPLLYYANAKIHQARK